MTKDEKFAILYAVAALVLGGWMVHQRPKKMKELDEACHRLAEALWKRQIARQRQWNT